MRIAPLADVSTEAPDATPTSLAPTPTPLPKTAPPCGAAVALPLMLVVGVVWGRGRRLGGR